MWMDHRAEEQAARITNTGHRVLSRVGGIMSPEMQPPKLLWLKEVRGEQGHRRTTGLSMFYFPLSVLTGQHVSDSTLFEKVLRSASICVCCCCSLIDGSLAPQSVVFLSESKQKLLEQSRSLFRPPGLPVLEGNWLFDAVSSV